MSQRPKLLLVRALVEPLRAAQRLHEEVVADLAHTTSRTLVHGALVMGVAAFELALADTLKYYLRVFPEKIGDVKVGFAASVGDDFVDLAAASYAANAAQRSFQRFMSDFAEQLSLDIAGLRAGVDAAREIKATRNLLLHNRLEVNEFYLNQAGPQRRESRLGAPLTADRKYVLSAIRALSGLLDALAEGSARKYERYTKIAAHRSLWAYLFSSPVMPYDDFWEVDETKDRIVAIKEGRYEAVLSSTEKFFLAFWRAHYKGRWTDPIEVTIHHLDSANNRKLRFLVSIAKEFPWE